MSLSEETKKIQWFIKAHPQITSLPNGQVNLNKKDVSALYVRLIDCIVDHNHLYYVENKPIISDKEYDELFDYLKRIEEHFPQIISSNSPTQWLVGQISGWFAQAKHKVKLASLENTYNAQDIREWDERIHKIVEGHKVPELVGAGSGHKVENQIKITYRVEPKFDGLSVELIYEKWKFVQAITRGDGLVGDDITSNVKTIKSIPHDLEFPVDVRVRGEIMMPKSVRKELNKEREEDGEIPFANTRNAAAGSIKLLDSREAARRKLVCFVYDILLVQSTKYKVQSTKYKVQSTLESLWLPVFPWVKIGKNIDEVVALCEDEKVKKMLEGEDIDFDGLVIKVESLDQRQSIWSTDHHPRWAVAYKFPAQVVATQVNSVDFQVGRTWIITPVANLEPVELSWVTIKRVSLHNWDFIKSKDIHAHDRVRLQRSGEVIPYIVSVIKDRRSKVESSKSKVQGVVKIHPPKVCPSCGERVVHEDIHYYCRNPFCPAQVKEKIVHFVSKNCMDIEGIGDSTVDVFVDQWLLKNVADIYLLLESKYVMQIAKLPWFGDKKITEMVHQIWESKKKPLWRLLNGLGIPHVGKKTALDLVKAVTSSEYKVTSLDDLTKIMSNEEFLTSIYGIGEKSVEGIGRFFGDRENKKILQRLEHVGVNFDPSKYAEWMLDAEHAKWSFSITWTFPASRETITQEMQKNWYLFHDNPTKTTNLMLVGEDPGSKKAKAESLGLKMYEWRDVVLKEFPFLKNIVSESVKPKSQSLF